MTTPLVNQEIYGRGFKFPFQFDGLTGGVAKNKGLPSVEDALIFIIGTFPGERFMAPNFGSRLNAALFEMFTPELNALVRTYLAEALNLEPRIEVLTKVQVEQDPAVSNGVLLFVQFRPIHQTDDRNLVFPLVRG